MYCLTIVLYTLLDYKQENTMFENDEQEQRHKIVNSKTSDSGVPISIIDFINLKMLLAFKIYTSPPELKQHYTRSKYFNSKIYTSKTFFSYVTETSFEKHVS